MSHRAVGTPLRFAVIAACAAAFALAQVAPALADDANSALQGVSTTRKNFKDLPKTPKQSRTTDSANSATTKTSEPLCVLSSIAMPTSWRPWGDVQKKLSAAPWSDSETKDVLYSIRRGLDELNDYYSKRPSAVAALKDDAVDSFIEVTYAAANTPAIQDAAQDGARRILAMLIAPHLPRGSNSVGCDEYESLLPLAIYAHSLYPTRDARIATMVTLTNAAYRTCGSLKAAMGYDYRRRLEARNVPTEHVFDMVIWSVWFTKAQLVPGLELSPAARNLPPALWRFLETYPLIGARAFSDGGSNTKFYDTAYLATHIAYVPTGVHRYPIYVEDSPSLYRFLRQNFYAVLQMGELDLVAEFVDSFRQYGCTELNDLQVRDGTRYLLKLFHAAGDSWISHREPDETGKVDDYDAVHKAWTGMLGVRTRIPEPAERDTYGGVVRIWLRHPR